MPVVDGECASGVTCKGVQESEQGIGRTGGGCGFQLGSGFSLLS